MSITRQERERAVLDLYHNQGKTIRDIAKEARMSFRDIGSILNKADEAHRKEQEQQQDNEQQLSLATQAYKLFSKGKTPIEVAVALNARESEVTRFYKEYLKLNHMHDLNIVYDELKGDIIPFLKLYRSARVAGMSIEHVVNLLRIADDDNLPALEYRYKALKQEVNSLQVTKINSNKTLQDLKNQILNSRTALNSCNLTYTQQVQKLAELETKRIALEDLVTRFENNNKEYLKIQHIAKQEVSSILSNAKVLLRLALLSLIESLRNDPVKYNSLIYYSIYGRQKQQQYSLSPENYFIEQRTAMLVEESEKLYKKLITDLSNRVIDDTAFSNSTLSSTSTDGTTITIKSSSPPAKSAAR